MDVSKHVEKAQEAVRKKNYAYAVSLYHQVLQLKPDHGEARADLRQALVKWSEYKKTPAFLAVIQGAFPRLSMLLGGLTKNSNQVILAAEKYLVHQPRNTGVNLKLGAALERAGHLRSAVAVYEFIGEDKAVGDEALKRAGMVYYSQKDLPKALACFEAVLKRSPRDSEAEKMRKNLAAEGVLSAGSYDPTKSSRELARDRDKQHAVEIDQRLVTTADERTQRIARLKEKLAGDPNDATVKRARRDLVDLHVKAREYRAAVSVLEQGIAAEPESFELRERLGDVRILHLDEQLRDARARAEQGDAAAKTDLADLTREKQELEIEEFTRRVAEHPTDLDLRFRLGRLVLEAGEADRAIENFQHSVKEPRRRVDSLLGLGAAFEKKKLFDLAKKQLLSALESIDAQSDKSSDIQYALACLEQKTGDFASAKDRFERIYERDIHFKDVAQRLDAVRAALASTARSAAPAAPAPSPEPKSAPAKPDEAGGSLYSFREH